MKLPTRAVPIAISIVAGLVGAGISGALWKKATGELPPNLANPGVQQRATPGKVLLFAVVSGAGASVIQAFTKRWTQNLVQKKRTP